MPPYKAFLSKETIVEFFFIVEPFFFRRGFPTSQNYSSTNYLSPIYWRTLIIICKNCAGTLKRKKQAFDNVAARRAKRRRGEAEDEKSDPDPESDENLQSIYLFNVFFLLLFTAYKYIVYQMFYFLLISVEPPSPIR